MASYQLINDAEESAIYMHAIRVRSFLCQQLSSLRDENRDWHYPFMLFAIKEGDTCKLLELDFVRKIVSIHLKDHSKSDFSFNQIKDVIQVQLLVNKYFEALYQSQRDLIVKILLYASGEFQNSNRLENDLNNEDYK